MTKLTKAALVAAVVSRTGLTRAQAAAAVHATLEGMTLTLTAGHPVGLPGLGTFSVLRTPARTGVRPSTGEILVIPPGRKVAFKLADELRRQL